MALVQLAERVGSPDTTGQPSDRPALAPGQPAPGITGTTLGGAAFDLSSLRGRPVLVNFWDAGCVPCREEFPLLMEKLAAHADTGLAIVGVLFVQAPGPARDFVAEYGATWPTIEDPSGAIRNAYRVAARPQSYFIDRDGILRSIQVGQMEDCEFERQFTALLRPLDAPPAASTASCGIGAEPTPSIEIPPPQ
jgi:cytochrome c biogenesis protein CcmG/thiol:disulfide interchange protein DsbE